MKGDGTQDLLRTRTRSGGGAAPAARLPALPVLTIACHPDPERVGQRAWLTALAGGGEVRVSRAEPLFAPPSGGPGRPLLDPWLSREPLRLRPAAAGIALERGGGKMALRADGRPVDGPELLPAADLGRGVVLELGERVVLVLRITDAPAGPERPPGELLGVSAAMARLREEIARVGPLDFPVLLRGESGTGKELAARALHAASPRSRQAFVAVNAGAIPRELAASEMFGAERGAYTGAERDRGGFFRQAHLGTLFLDEIGEAPSELQVLLLRALETGEIQPLGGGKPQRADVRLVAATDADLEAAVAAGRFRSPLLHRLASYELRLPPLRERREDLGPLFFHFLRAELEALGQLRRLLPRSLEEEAYVPAALVARLLLDPWPGNVRQLRNVVRRLVIASGGDRLEVPAGSEFLAEPPPDRPASPPAAPPAVYRAPAEVGEEELLAALRAEGFNVHRAARRLGVSRTTLYKLMEDSPRVRRAPDLGRDEIARVWQENEEDLESAAAALEVSPRALQLRMRELGLRS